MKKIVFMAVILLLASVFILSTICWAEKTTISFIGMKQAGYRPQEMDAIARSFEKMHPDITVKTTYVSYDALHDKLVTSLAAGGKAFDVMPVDDIWLAEFVEAGWLYDMSAKIPREMRSGIGETWWKEVSTYKGKTWIVPWYPGIVFFYYNDRMLKEAGISDPPRTWDEFAEQCQKIKNKGIVEYPAIWPWAQRECSICAFVTLLYGFGAEFFDKNRNPVFNSKQGVEALTWMVNSVKEGLSNPASVVSVEEEVRHTFSQGAAAFSINWDYQYTLANDPKESKVAGQVKMALMPAQGDIVSATNQGSMGYGIAADSDHKDAALSYLFYFTSKEIQKKYAHLIIPVWTSLYDDPELIKEIPVLLSMFAKQMPYSHGRPDVPYYMELSKTLQVAIQEALLERKSPKRALDDAVKEIKRISG